MDVIGVEILRSLGRFFLYPLTYVFIIAIFWISFRRVKRERKDFHTRVYDVIQQFTSPILFGISFGLGLSVFVLFLGIEIPVGMLALLSVIWLILLPLRHARWLSITVAGSIALLIVPFLPAGGTDLTWLNLWLIEIDQMNILNLVWLITGLFLAESLLILADGWKKTSPAIVKSKRGKMVGEHIATRLWILPIFLLFPVGEWAGTSWWPLFELSSGQTFGLALFPFLIGFQASIHSEFPIDGVKKLGKRLLALNFLVIALAVATYFFAVLGLIVAAVILIGRELIYFYYHTENLRRTSLFARQENGLKILGVLPYSTADKMNLQIGEIIYKANGREINSQRGFYEALQQNPAFCKLEVIDHQGEIRFAQSSVFQGGHYQIGCLFVPDDEMGNLSYRALRSSVVIHNDRDHLGDFHSKVEKEFGVGIEKQEEKWKEKPKEKIEETGEETRDENPFRMNEASEISGNIKLDKRKTAEKTISANENNFEEAIEENLIEADKKNDDDVKKQEDVKEKNQFAEANRNRNAYRDELPYGQAAGLSAFYDEFRKSKPEKNEWRASEEKNEDDRDVDDSKKADELS